MYHAHNILRLSAVLFISFAIFAIGFVAAAPSAHAAGLSSRIEERLCKQLEKVTARLPITLPAFCKPTPPPVAPTVDVTVNPTSITNGASATLAWTSTNADSCTASNGWSGSKGTSGSVSVNPTVTTTYTLTCTKGVQTASDSATLTVTAAPVAPTLTLVKTVTNNNGGTATAANFQAKIDGSNVAWSVAQTVTAGTYTASEITLAGYTASVWGGDCAADGKITLAAGEDKTCTITNDDQPGTLTVKKVVIRDDGGTAATTTFSFQVNGGTAVPFEADGQNDMTVNAGTYSVTEPAVADYTTTYANCTDVAVANGETETCTITNNDVAVTPTTGHLIVDKVTQPTGSSAVFSITASGNGTITGGGAGVVTDATNKDYEVAPGTYSVVEGAEAGWVIISNTCTDIVVAAGETKNCTITNAKLPTLTVVKVVVNDNDGTKQVSDFPLFIDGAPVTSWATTTVATGTRAVSETNQTGYVGTFSGDCNASGDVTVVYGDVKTCTITNNDVPSAPAIDHLLISEVYYDVDGAHGIESPPSDANEWVEIYNPTSSDADLTNWWISDATAFDKIPDGTVIPAGGFLVFTATTTTSAFWGNTSMISLNTAIGSGLANAGDAVHLLNANGATTTVDAMSYGTNESVFTLLGVLEGHSLARTSLTVDTDTAANWEDRTIPTPGL